MINDRNQAGELASGGVSASSHGAVPKLGEQYRDARYCECLNEQVREAAFMKEQAQSQNHTFPAFISQDIYFSSAVPAFSFATYVSGTLMSYSDIIQCFLLRQRAVVARLPLSLAIAKKKKDRRSTEQQHSTCLSVFVYLIEKHGL